MEYITLNNGIKMPLAGFGTMNIHDLDECARVLKEAYEEGYRLFDCASIYGNEHIVGEAIEKAGLPREEIFITTKIWFTEFEGEHVQAAITNSMKKLRVDYLDLVLIHWPYGNTYHAYRELEKMYQQGLIKAIGVSNYQASQLVDLIHFNQVIPTVNQIKTTMCCQRNELHTMMKERGVVLQGYQVFGQEETKSVYEHPLFIRISNKYNKTKQQIVLKYLIQNQISVITRPMERRWMKDNLDIFDFTLTKQELEELSSFDDILLNTTPSLDYQRTIKMMKT